MRRLGFILLVGVLVMLSKQTVDSLALPKDSDSNSQEAPEMSTALSNEDIASDGDGDDDFIHHQLMPVPIPIPPTLGRNSDLKENNSKGVQVERGSKSVQDVFSDRKVFDNFDEPNSFDDLPAAPSTPRLANGQRPNIEREDVIQEVIHRVASVAAAPVRRIVTQPTQRMAIERNVRKEAAHVNRFQPQRKDGGDGDSPSTSKPVSIRRQPSMTSARRFHVTPRISPSNRAQPLDVTVANVQMTTNSPERKATTTAQLQFPESNSDRPTMAPVKLTTSKVIRFNPVAFRLSGRKPTVSEPTSPSPIEVILTTMTTTTTAEPTQTSTTATPATRRNLLRPISVGNRTRPPSLQQIVRTQQPRITRIHTTTTNTPLVANSQLLNRSVVRNESDSVSVNEPETPVIFANQTAEDKNHVETTLGTPTESLVHQVIPNRYNVSFPEVMISYTTIKTPPTTNKTMEVEYENNSSNSSSSSLEEGPGKIESGEGGDEEEANHEEEEDVKTEEPEDNEDVSAVPLAIINQTEVANDSLTLQSVSLETSGHLLEVVEKEQNVFVNSTSSISIATLSEAPYTSAPTAQETIDAILYQQNVENGTEASLDVANLKETTLEPLNNSSSSEQDILIYSDAVQWPIESEEGTATTPTSVTIELTDEHLRQQQIIIIENRPTSDGINESDEQHQNFSLSSVNGTMELMDKPTTAATQQDDSSLTTSPENLLVSSLEETTSPVNDTQLKDVDEAKEIVAAMNPIDQTVTEENQKKIAPQNRKQKLLSKLTDQVLNKLFPSEVDEGMRNQVRQFSLQALDSFRTADSQSVAASAFSQRAAASSATTQSSTVFLPLLIACLLFGFNS